MKKEISLILYFLISNTVLLYSQIPTYKTDNELLKGKIRKIETIYRGSDKKKTKEVTEYDTLGRITFKKSDYNKIKSQEYFYYDSFNNLVMHDIKYKIPKHVHNSEKTVFTYEYKYDKDNKIITETQLSNGRLMAKYDSIVYDNLNNPIEYTAQYIGTSEKISIHYSNAGANQKTIYIEEMQPSGIINKIEQEYIYNDQGFIIKKKTKSITHLSHNGIKNYPYLHTKEDDFTDFKYDKQGNWTECTMYTNMDGRGRYLSVKVKRKIKYY